MTRRPTSGRAFAEGLQIILDIVFADEPQGMGLHRVEANIQPANVRSAGLVRSLGFVHEGSPRISSTSRAMTAAARGVTTIT